MRFNDVKYKASLYEGVRIGKSEIERTLQHSDDIQVGIEYEIKIPNPHFADKFTLIKMAKNLLRDYSIPHIHAVTDEHDHMTEIITDVMPLKDGLIHIKRMFDMFTREGIEIPNTAGLHVSISHKDGSKKDINFTKFLVLLSGEYLHSIFPERDYVESIELELRQLVNTHNPKSLNDFEYMVTQHFDKKYVSAKISDYFTMNGRIELRFFGGKDHHKQYNEIRWQLLRAVFIMTIAFDKDMYRKEYLKKVAGFLHTPSFPNDPEWLKSLTPSKALKLTHKYGQQPELEDIIAQDAEASLTYALDFLGGERFIKGEPAIATEEQAIYMYMARCLGKNRFPEAEELISENEVLSFRYATNHLQDRFPLGEPTISDDAEVTKLYVRKILEFVDYTSFPELEEAIIDNEDVELLIDVYIDCSPNGEIPLKDEVVDLVTNYGTIDNHLDYMHVINLYNDEPIRVPEIESNILAYPDKASDYALLVLKGRWEEAEPVIAQEAKPSLEYAQHVLKGRFPEGEPAIKEVDYLWNKYQKFIQDAS